MRISFDLDDTLILYDKSIKSTERLLNGEYLREGTTQLLKRLQEDHELCIYTTSFRNAFILKLSFRLRGIRIANVINQSEHLKVMKSLSLKNPPTKFPSQFGIDLHVDDLEGVRLEGEKYGFKVLQLEANDSDWERKVLEAVQDFSVK